MKFFAPVLVALLACSGCASLSSTAPSAYASARMEGDAARPASAAGWVRSELYFGVGAEQGAGNRPQADTISEAQWRDFLHHAVHPRVPGGPTAFDPSRP